MKRRTRATVVLLAGLLLLDQSAWAQTNGGGDADKNDQVVLTGRVDVPEGVTVDSVVIFDGPVDVQGVVEGSVVAFNGPVTISGDVHDDVVAFNGRVVIADGGHVGGDVRSRRATVVQPGGTVDGQTKGLDVERFSDTFRAVSRIALWVGFTFSTLVLGLLLLLFLPRGMAAAAQAARQRTGASIGWGVILFLGLPLLAIVAIVTLVGIPLGLALLLALLLVYTIGYTVSAWIVGRILLRDPTSRFLAFLAGWAILRAVAAIPYLGGTVWTLAAIFGLGAIAVAAWRSRTMPPPATVVIPDLAAERRAPEL